MAGRLGEEGKPGGGGTVTGRLSEPWQCRGGWARSRAGFPWPELTGGSSWMDAGGGRGRRKGKKVVTIGCRRWWRWGPC